MTLRFRLANPFIGAILAAVVNMPLAAVADDQFMSADQIAFQFSQSKAIGPAKAPPKVNLPAVTFEFNSARLTWKAEKQLDELAKALGYRSYAKLPFLIAGHTDGLGSERYNMSLSEQRAHAVRTYLINQHKIAGTRIEATGMGESKLLEGVPPDDAKHRRVEILLKE